ncbi:MAG: hypothetical protein V3W31_09695 [Thermodesulfobacteriota bacterium]
MMRSRLIAVAVALTVGLFMLSSVDTADAMMHGKKAAAEDCPLAGTPDCPKKGMMDKKGTGGMHTMSKGGMRGMGGMDCPLLGLGKGLGAGIGKGVEIEVTEVDDGVTITLRSDDKNTARRLQLTAEMMKLMREMMELRHEEYKDLRGQ